MHNIGYVKSKLFKQSLPGIKLHILPTLTKVLVYPICRVLQGSGSTEHVDVFTKAEAVVSSSAELAVVVEVVGVGDHLALLPAPVLVTNLSSTVLLFAETPLWPGRRLGLAILGIISHEECSCISKALTIDLDNIWKIVLYDRCLVMEVN